LQVSGDAIDEVASVGYDPTYGARPLKRVIQRDIQNPLATALLKNSYPDGATIQVGYNGSEFTFRSAAGEGSDAAPPETVSAE
jgi:ATP-dependent Clp protease ATP-binding subunit ClpB